jgi:dipeptidyl-peptidase-4
MTNKILLCLLILGACLNPVFGQKNISLEDIWLNYSYYSKSVPGFNFMNDGESYSRLQSNKVQKYSIKSGQFIEDLFALDMLPSSKDLPQSISGYSFSADEQKMLVESGPESIYRYSYKADYFVWANGSLDPLFDEGKVMHAAFDPSGTRVAFVFDNNLYIKNLKDGNVDQVTTDGAFNEVINGSADWVYEEEFGFTKAFQWSTDGKYVAYYRFDERAVKEFTMTVYKNEMYPEYQTFKYPKVGEQNATVSVFIYNVDSKTNIQADLPVDPELYTPRIKWANSEHGLCVTMMNRHQNRLSLNLVDPTTGDSKILLEEENKYYIDVTDNLTFLKDGKSFVWTSEMDGYNHVYRYDMSGALMNQITKGPWELTSFYGVDEDNELIYFQSTEEGSTERYVYEIGMDGKKRRKMTPAKGWNSAQFSSTYDYYVLNHSALDKAPSYTVFNRKGKEVRVIEDNERLQDIHDGMDINAAELMTITTEKGVDLNAYIIKPADFDPNKEYPLFMYLYGGPGSQQAVNSWRGQNYWWFQMLAQQGYVIACVDNRGTGGKGEAFKKMTYQQLGHYETIDQINAAKYFGGLDYIDVNRIGIFGWSYGGYMSSLCLLKGNDVFKAAIAVAPVTNWKWYDSIYTERYMRTYAENQSGFSDNSPVNFADQLLGNYLLVHGLADDNVHYQHTAEMTRALVNANKQFDTYIYPNKNHGIYGGPTRFHLFRKMTDFLDQKLKNDYSKVGSKK